MNGEAIMRWMLGESALADENNLQKYIYFYLHKVFSFHHPFNLFQNGVFSKKKIAFLHHDDGSARGSFHNVHVSGEADLSRALYIDGRDGSHEAALEKPVGVGVWLLVVTVQLGPHKVFLEAVRSSRGAAVTETGSWRTVG